MIKVSRLKAYLSQAVVLVIVSVGIVAAHGFFDLSSISLGFVLFQVIPHPSESSQVTRFLREYGFSGDTVPHEVHPKRLIPMARQESNLFISVAISSSVIGFGR